MTMKRMLETSFPGINVFLHNYPPAFPKRVLSKVMPVLQVVAIGTIMAGDQIFPRLGIAPPPWFYSLRANRFGTMASIWLFGNFAQSFLQSSGAFEVYCNGDLVCFLHQTHTPFFFFLLLTHKLLFCMFAS
jgi:selT/selW/selH-like putative selenoprotein